MSKARGGSRKRRKYAGPRARRNNEPQWRCRLCNQAERGWDFGYDRDRLCAHCMMLFKKGKRA